MNSKKKYAIFSSVIFTVLVLMVFSNPVLASTTSNAYEAKQDYNWLNSLIYESDVKLGEDVVFSTDGDGGSTNYGIWICGVNNYGIGETTLIDVEIHARCYVKIQTITGKRATTTYSWEPLPLNLIKMSGATGESFSFGVASGIGCNTASDINNGWRHLGGFGSSTLWHHQKFTALLKLKVDNNIATDYYRGKVVSQTSQSTTCWYIKQIQFKIEFHFEYCDGLLEVWLPLATHTYILGDGNIPSGYTGFDVNKIYFVPGTSD